MMELTERQRLYLPKTVHWEREDLHLFLDPEAPHWIGTDWRGAEILRWIEEGHPFGEIVQRYTVRHGVAAARAWLHAHDFIQALLRAEFASREPVESLPYLGRAAYANARPKALKELWFHTNNICNLSCVH